jgi:hypothetical protein
MLLQMRPQRGIAHILRAGRGNQNAAFCWNVRPIQITALNAKPCAPNLLKMRKALLSVMDMTRPLAQFATVGWHDGHIAGYAASPLRNSLSKRPVFHG